MPSKKAGRPRSDNPKTNCFIAKFSDEEISKLNYCAETIGVSKVEIIRIGTEIICQELKEIEEKGGRELLSEDIKPEFANLLKNMTNIELEKLWYFWKIKEMKHQAGESIFKTIVEERENRKNLPQ